MFFYGMLFSIRTFNCPQDQIQT